jgi:hypothetical protein
VIALIGGGNCSSQNNFTTLIKKEKKKKKQFYDVVQTKILNVQTSSFCCCCRDPFASRLSDSRIANGRPYIICPNLFSSSAVLFLSLAYKIVKKNYSLSVLQSAMSGESASAIQRSQVSWSGFPFSFAFVWLLGNRGKINGLSFPLFL